MLFIPNVRTTKLVSALLAAALIYASQGAVLQAADAKKVRVGTSYIHALPGNPSTGYRWRLNEARSQNLTIVKVEDRGYGKPAQVPEGKVLVGAPASYLFHITVLAPGSAKLLFEYVRPWEGKPIRADELSIQANQ